MLEVSDLVVSVGPHGRELDIVSSVSFSIGKGEVLGLVGESGCGKSMTSLAIMGLLPEHGPRLRNGVIRLDGRDVTGMAPYRRVASGQGGIAMIFQEPMTSLNPVLRIGEQIDEAVRVHDKSSRRAAKDRVVDLLRMVRIPDAAAQVNAFPHQLSGGMRQRVMIAIALACRPKVLIADEPTTALDVTVQLEILSLLRELCDTLNTALLLITHDLGVVAQLADRAAVMYAGKIVETATVKSLFAAPAHPYTAGLMACVPGAHGAVARLKTIKGQAPLLGTLGAGCAFAPRCSQAHPDCLTQAPSVLEFAPDHQARCKYPLQNRALS
jgi:peptide/nickel transport system ATP-binding protein